MADFANAKAKERFLQWLTEVPAETKINLGIMTEVEPYVWVECVRCEGLEGFVDDDEVWHPCPSCDGEGGYIE